MTGLQCALMRGGTSRGAFLLAEDLPTEPAARDDLLVRTMGGPDELQVDGLGGGHPLTSKVAVVSRSTSSGADVDYLFLQVVPDAQVVTAAQPCGNMLSAVGPFALERGLVAPTGDVTDVRVRMVNTGTVATLRVQTPAGVVTYEGDTEIAGVPGTAAPVAIGLDAGPGALLPTGHLVDTVGDVEVTCIDNGMPCVLVRAADLGCTGTEPVADLEDDEPLRARIHELRAAALVLMGLDPDPDATSVPKIVLVARPAAGGALATRSFIPVRVHRSIGVVAAASVAAGAVLPGTVAHDLAHLPPAGEPLHIEHPTGHLAIELTTGPDGRPTRTSVVRTARMILDGVVHPRPAAPAPEEEH